jgi:hypothetical protein
VQLEEKIRFSLGTLQPMAQYTLRHLASVIGVRSPEVGEHIGTGFRCILSGRRAIVTAAHVVERGLKGYPDFAVSAGYGVPPFLVKGTIQLDGPSDVAVYFVPDDYPDQREDLSFWPEARIERASERLSTDYLFVHGFPGVRCYPSALLSGIVYRSLPYGAMQRIEDLPDDLAPFQFALNFDPRNIRVDPQETPDLLPDPRGLSGSPVFRIGASGRSIKDWSPEWSQLVGLVTQWRQDSEILVATDATKILELAERDPVHASKTV